MLTPELPNLEAPSNEGASGVSAQPPRRPLFWSDPDDLRRVSPKGVLVDLRRPVPGCDAVCVASGQAPRASSLGSCVRIGRSRGTTISLCPTFRDEFVASA